MAKQNKKKKEKKKTVSLSFSCFLYFYFFLVDYSDQTIIMQSIDISLVFRVINCVAAAFMAIGGIGTIIRG